MILDFNPSLTWFIFFFYVCVICFTCSLFLLVFLREIWYILLHIFLIQRLFLFVFLQEIWYIRLHISLISAPISCCFSPRNMIHSSAHFFEVNSSCARLLYINVDTVHMATDSPEWNTPNARISYNVKYSYAYFLISLTFLFLFHY